jgi:hypothetical protein
MFVGEVRSLPKSGAPERYFTRVGSVKKFYSKCLRLDDEISSFSITAKISLFYFPKHFNTILKCNEAKQYVSG